jgi:glyoxylase-like metal-dependent hydrolase (beta-lactamase superfamily II)
MSEGKFREVRPGIYLLHLPLPMRPTIVNVYLLHGGDEWALVDTGMNTDDSKNAVQSILQQIGCAPRRIRKLICTHHHPDHFGGSAYLKELTGADVHLHPVEYEKSLTFAPGSRGEQAFAFFRANGVPIERFAHIPSPADFWSGMYRTVAPDVHLGDGDVLHVGEREIEVIWTPGHAPGHCVLYLRRERLMIVGDHLLPKITPHVGYFPGGGIADPLGDFLESQRKVQRFDVDEVLPAHGAVYSDHVHRANQLIQHHHYRLELMLDIIKARPAAAYEVASQAFNFDHDAPLSYQFPATFETLAHLRHLEVLGRASCAHEGGVDLWRAL